MKTWQNGIYGLPCGVDFAAQTVRGIMARLEGQPPETLARMTIWVNAGITQTALRDAFEAATPPSGALILPRILPVAQLGAMLPGRAESPLGRRLELGDLVSQLIEATPDLASGQSVPQLTASLSALMTEMQLEGAGPEALSQIDAAQHAEHWRRALRFLDIAAGYYLDDPARDAAGRMRLAAERCAREWAEGTALPDAPVLLVGSTGSHGATRLLLQAVAALPEGAVVLPGVDFEMPARVWAELDDEDHPQARYADLQDPPIRPWVECDAPIARNRLISLALRPAPVTDQWIAEGPALTDLAAATEAMTLIEADQPQDEAEAIALAIRDAYGAGHRVTMIAADRELVRRVTAALDRWGLQPRDAAGQPLHLRPPGLLLRLLAGQVGRPLGVDRLLDLLKATVTATGAQRNQHLLHTRRLELRLRAKGPAFPDVDFLQEWAARATSPEARDWALWLADLVGRLGALEHDHAARPLADRLADLEALADAFAAGPGGSAGDSQLWDRADGKKARAVLDHLRDQAGVGAHPMGPRDFADLLDELMQAQPVRRADLGDPAIRIHGPREVRAVVGQGQDGDEVTILAGLNEGGWPQPPAPDPWLSRDMRRAAGLPLPDRQIGLSAHDFQQAIAAPRVILTRARRDAEAETIPSRWLNRLLNLLGGLPQPEAKAALEAMRARGTEITRRARALAQPQARVAPAPRPAPIPPAQAFTNLSVTQIRQLLRDPYAVYARKVLRLDPLSPLRPEPDAALRGQVLHKVAERLLTPPPKPGTPIPELRQRFLELSAEIIAQEVPWPATRAFWMARMREIADQIARDEAPRLSEGRPVIVETRGALRADDLARSGIEFTLTAKPDRIDVLHDGTARIYDYKSGKPPTEGQIAAFDKQLPLEAVMAERGAFEALGPRAVSGLAYIQLGGSGETHPRSYDADTGAQTWERLTALLRAYLTGELGFTARKAMEKADDPSDYDQISRFGEWGLDDMPQTIRLIDKGDKT